MQIYSSLLEACMRFYMLCALLRTISKVIKEKFFGTIVTVCYNRDHC